MLASLSARRLLTAGRLKMKRSNGKRYPNRLDQAGALELAAQIRQFWAERGYRVETVVEQMSNRQQRAPIWTVRSKPLERLAAAQGEGCSVAPTKKGPDTGPGPKFKGDQMPRYPKAAARRKTRTRLKFLHRIGSRRRFKWTRPFTTDVFRVERLALRTAA
jgi:hypothetical protein